MEGRSFQGMDGEVNKKILIGIAGLLLGMAMPLHSSQVDFPELTGPYFGQKPPGMTPEAFNVGITEIDRQKGYPSFGYDGKTFYFLYQSGDGYFIMMNDGGRWTKPQIVPYSVDYGFGEANISPDAKQIVFCSKKNPFAESVNKQDFDLWIMERKNLSWNKPKHLGHTINTELHEAFPTLSNAGHLYFFRETEGERGSDIFYSRYVNGQYRQPLNLGSSVNSEKHDCDPFIASDESFLIFCVRDRNDGFGDNDLYISYKMRDGSWTRSVNMGSSINTEAEEITPHVTPNGQYLFFTSNRNGNYNIYWVDAKIIEALKPDEVK